jgi:hypothetical protein
MMEATREKRDNKKGIIKCLNIMIQAVYIYFNKLFHYIPPVQAGTLLLPETYHLRHTSGKHEL